MYSDVASSNALVGLRGYGALMLDSKNSFIIRRIKINNERKYTLVKINVIDYNSMS